MASLTDTDVSTQHHARVSLLHPVPRICSLWGVCGGLVGDTIPRRDPSALYLLEAAKQLVSWGSTKSPSDQRQYVGFNWLSGRED